MWILDLLNTRESDATFVGKTECSAVQLPKVLLGMMNKMGMSNPAGLYASSNKGISLTKKGNNYTLTLYAYKPPVTVSWTGTIPMHQLIAVIDEIVQKRQKIGYINVINTLDGDRLFQLGISA